MKSAKRLKGRWISPCSGTVPFWQPETAVPPWSVFFEVSFSQTFFVKKTWRSRVRTDWAPSGAVAFWRPERPVCFPGSTYKPKLWFLNVFLKSRCQWNLQRYYRVGGFCSSPGWSHFGCPEMYFSKFVFAFGVPNFSTRTGLATSWHHFTWPPPQHPATQNPQASPNGGGPFVLYVSLLHRVKVKFQVKFKVKSKVKSKMKFKLNVN